MGKAFNYNGVARNSKQQTKSFNRHIQNLSLKRIIAMYSNKSNHLFESIISTVAC